MSKPFYLGLICGRFQTFHKGHEQMFDIGKVLCENLLIFVGSSQYSGTERNPFTIETRIQMIRSVYPDKNVHIYALKDLSEEDEINRNWGKYLLENVKICSGEEPDIMIYGNDESRKQWFTKDDIGNTAELILNRKEMPISGTMLRKYMIFDQKEEWMKHVNPAIHNMYDELREQLLRVDYYKNMIGGDGDDV